MVIPTVTNEEYADKFLEKISSRYVMTERKKVCFVNSTFRLVSLHLESNYEFFTRYVERKWHFPELRFVVWSAIISVVFFFLIS